MNDKKTSKWVHHKGKKVSDIFEVLRRMPEITIKYAFVSPVLFVCGLVPIMFTGNHNNTVYWKIVLLSFAIVSVLSVILMYIASLEKAAEYRHIKMIFVFKEETLFSLIIPTVLSAYYVFSNIAVSVSIIVLCVILRGIKIWSLERKIKNGTYGYHMDAKVNTALIGIASMAGVFGFRLFINSGTFESKFFSLAFNLIVVWLIFIVILIVFMVEPIVAIKKIQKDKRKIK